MAFSFTIKQHKTYLEIKMAGTLLSLYESKELLEKLEYTSPESARVLIDLSDLRHMSSEGFNTLLKILTFARNHQGDVVIINLSEELKKLFIISKLNAIFTLAGSKKEAGALLAGS